MASISVPDTIGFGETLTIEVADTKNRYARVVVERDGVVVHDSTVRVRGGLARAYIGATPTWDGSGLPVQGRAETGKLVGGRWSADASATFTVN